LGFFSFLGWFLSKEEKEKVWSSTTIKGEVCNQGLCGRGIERERKRWELHKKRGFSFLLLFSFWAKVRIGCIGALGLSSFLALLFPCTHLLIVNFLWDCLRQWTYLNLREPLKSGVVCDCLSLLFCFLLIFRLSRSGKIGQNFPTLGTMINDTIYKSCCFKYDDMMLWKFLRCFMTWRMIFKKMLSYHKHFHNDSWNRKCNVMHDRFWAQLFYVYERFMHERCNAPKINLECYSNAYILINLLLAIFTS